MIKKFKYLFMFLVLFCFSVGVDLAFNKNVYIESVPEIVQAEGDIALPSSYCMRDEYYLVTSNQHDQGLCWDLSSSTVFTTAVMRSTNQYIDYSEGWISEAYAKDHTNYLPGDGGGFNYFDSTATSWGLVQEQDFMYEDSYSVSRENVDDLHEYFLQFSDTTIVKNYEKIRYSLPASVSQDVRSQTIKTLKEHIYTKSALYFSFNWSTIQATYSGKTLNFKRPDSTSTNSHALTIIGWDDNITANYNDVTYRGAWVFLNSWGNYSGDNGIFYLFYDDPQVTFFYGYEYVEEYDDLYFFNEITSSTAEFVTDQKGAYTGTFVPTTGVTKQKNIFTDNSNVSLTYSYKISPDTYVTDISIFKLQKDVTNDFNITNDTQNNLITITAKQDLDFSSYKVVFTYSNGEESESLCGAFYIVNGTETEYVEVYLNSGANKFDNLNYQMQGSRPLNNGTNQLVYAVSSDATTMLIYARMTTYAGVIQLRIFNGDTGEVYKETAVWDSPTKYLGIDFEYNLFVTSYYKIVIVGANGAENVYHLHLLKINTRIDERHAKINYTLFGGENSFDNYKTCVISENKQVTLYAPAKDGYGFCGWFYSKDCDQSSMLKMTGENFYLEFDKLICYEDFNVGYWLNKSSATYSNLKATQVFNIFNVYAKWVKLDENTEYNKIYITAYGTDVDEFGIVYVASNSNKNISLNYPGYKIAELYVDGLLVDSTTYAALLQTGIDFNNVSADHNVVVTFEPKTIARYFVYHWLQAIGVTDNVVNDKYYDIPVIEEFNNATVNDYTNAVARSFNHFTAQNFEQQLVSPRDDTIVNIYYNRDVFEILITFNGARDDSQEYNISESVLYGQSKTYNICPSGYIVSSCLVNGEAATGNTITLSNISTDFDIVVNLQVERYSVTILDIQNGSIASSGSLTNIEKGESRQFTISANQGYTLKQVTVNNEAVDVIDNSFEIVVLQNVTISVKFEKIDEIEPETDEEDNEEIGVLPLILIIGGGITLPTTLALVWFIIRRKRVYF